MVNGNQHIYPSFGDAKAQNTLNRTTFAENFDDLHINNLSNQQTKTDAGLSVSVHKNYSSYNIPLGKEFQLNGTDYTPSNNYCDRNRYPVEDNHFVLPTEYMNGCAERQTSFSSGSRSFCDNSLRRDIRSQHPDNRDYKVYYSTRLNNIQLFLFYRIFQVGEMLGQRADSSEMNYSTGLNNNFRQNHSSASLRDGLRALLPNVNVRFVSEIGIYGIGD